MIKLKIKKGDNVKIITGDDKGKTGNVIKVFPEIRKILVKGIILLNVQNILLYFSHKVPYGLPTFETPFGIHLLVCLRVSLLFGPEVIFRWWHLLNWT